MDLFKHAPISTLSENDLRLMRIFRVVAESGGLTAAELRLNMERSTISRHIKALEHRLGGCLCLRGPSGFELTDFGDTVLAAAVAACDMLDRVRDDLNRARNVLTGDLHVGIADNCLSNPACRISEALARLSKAAPNVRIHLVVHPPADLARELAARQLHLCINGALQREEDFVRHPLFQEEFRLYARRRHDVPSARLPDLVAAGYGIVTRLSEPHSERLAALLPEARRSEALGLEAVAALVAGGQHVGLLPTHYATLIAPFCPLDEVEAADHLAYQSPFFLNYERSRPLSAPGRLFRDIVRDVHPRDEAPAIAAAR
ncbi:LysR family transcriptional regulator [Antarcticirhabdus aurantiaca]|nr:LysR family transcriptional regulator [Antarcticirhabdus aurantiaca]